MILAIALLIGPLLLGCAPDRTEEKDALRDHENLLDQCRASLANSSRIPIIGGGFLDTKYLSFNNLFVKRQNGECGIDGFAADFYWTGERIVVNAPTSNGLAAGQPVPAEWRALSVGVRFGNLQRARACQQNPSHDKSCQPQLPPFDPSLWPTDRRVPLKNYPGIEYWMPAERPKVVLGGIDFVIADWPRSDGRPRSINCYGIGASTFDVTKMTREDYRNIDFSQRSFPCQIEYGDFSVRGGAARVRTSTASLEHLVPMLRALEAYINQAVIQEGAK